MDQIATPNAAEADISPFQDAIPRPWAPNEQSAAPPGVAVFTTNASIRRFAERTGAIVHWPELDRGGHVAALESPDLLLGDIRACFRPLR